MNYQYAIVQQNGEQDSPYTPEVTVFTFPDAATASRFPHNGERLKAGDTRIPAFGEPRVQYEPHGFEGGQGIYPAL